MIPRTFLYDEYIGRPKFTEQKKPIWVYSSSPPHKWGRNKKTEEIVISGQSEEILRWDNFE